MAERFHFTKASIERLPTPAKRTYHRDTKQPKLGLYVTQTGRKTYFAALTIDGKTRRIPLGRFPDLSVPLARSKAMEKATEVAQGIDPVAKRRADKAAAITLSEALDQYIDTKKRAGKMKPRTARDYRGMVERTFTDWLDKPLAGITEKEVLTRYLERGQTAKAQTDYGFRVLRAVFNHARAAYKHANGTSLFQSNPTDLVSDQKLRFSIPRKRTTIKSTDLALWWTAVDGLDNPIVREYLQFLLLTGCRRTEAASLRWEDIYFTAGTFHLANTKNGTPVDLPLPRTTATALHQRRMQDGYVFPAATGKTGYLADPRKSINRVRKESGVSFSPHDLRRTFISLANGLDINMYTTKALVNHTVSRNDVTMGYDVPDMARLKHASSRIEDAILRLAGRRTADVVQLRSNQ